MIKLATWNINSVRLRQDIVTQFLKQYDLDILCLQETKVQDDHFPLAAFKQLGYTHTIFSGEKSYNGVAIVSRIPLENQTMLSWVGKGDKRHISATLPNGLEIHNFYVPAGGDEPDPEINPKYDHKLKFVEEATDWFKKHRSSKDNIVLVGDLNIAPLEHDVWSHKQLLKVVSHTPPETTRFAKWQKSIDWVDAPRLFVPDTEKLYSWWSYRNRDWKKSNRGRRLDHVWVTPNLRDAVKYTSIPSEIRDWEKPSDHVPVIMHLEL